MHTFHRTVRAMCDPPQRACSVLAVGLRHDGTKRDVELHGQAVDYAHNAALD